MFSRLWVLPMRVLEWALLVVLASFVSIVLWQVNFLPGLLAEGARFIEYVPGMQRFSSLFPAMWVSGFAGLLVGRIFFCTATRRRMNERFKKKLARYEQNKSGGYRGK